MVDQWQPNLLLIGIALAVALVLLVLLLSKGRRKVQIERDDTPADTSVKRNQALIDLPPAASTNPLVTPSTAPEAKPEPALVPASPQKAVTAPVAQPAPVATAPVAAERSTKNAAQQPAAAPNSGTIVAPMLAPDPVSEPSVVVENRPAANAPIAPAPKTQTTTAAPEPEPSIAEAIAPAPEAEVARPLDIATPAPASSGSDELTRIKGLGPKLAETLHALGVISFAQIAAWDDAAVDRIDEQLGRFKGRIRRDNWVEQARLLAEGNIAGYEDRFGKI